MIVVMEEGASEAQVQAVIDRLVDLEFSVHRSTGMVHTVLGGVGPEDRVDPTQLEVMDGVKECLRIISPYKLASRQFRPGGTVVESGAVRIGGPALVALAGPNLVESREQIESSAKEVAACGGAVLCANAFQPPGGSPESVAPGAEGLRWLRQAARSSGLLAATEVFDTAQIASVEEHVDLLVVPSWAMQNYQLLREAGRLRKPVVIKRGIGASVDELLMAAEYVMRGGNYDVILCERGIRSFESHTRLTLDIAAIPLIRKLSHLPVIVDASGAAGRRDKVAALAKGAVAAGADGVMLEVHPDPDRAASEGAQSLKPAQFAALMAELKRLAQALERGF